MTLNRRQNLNRRTSWLATAAVFVLLAAGCGTDASTSTVNDDASAEIPYEHTNAYCDEYPYNDDDVADTLGKLSKAGLLAACYEQVEHWRDNDCRIQELTRTTLNLHDASNDATEAQEGTEAKREANSEAGAALEGIGVWMQRCGVGFQDTSNEQYRLILGNELYEEAEEAGLASGIE